LAVALKRVLSKFLTKILHLSTQPFDLSITHLVGTTINPDKSFSAFFCFDTLGAISNLTFHFWVTDNLEDENPATLAGAAALAVINTFDIRVLVCI